MEPDKQITSILNGYQPACVLMAANRLRIFDRIADGPRSAEAVASDLSLSPKGTERLLNALCAMDIVDKHAEGFQLPDAWKPYLVTGGSHCMQQWIQLVADLMEVWLELPRFVESGQPIKSIMEMLGNKPEEMRAFIDAMHDKGLKATWLIAREIPLGDYRRMLDVGGGPGTYALEWAKLHNHLKATVFDIPPVVAVARDYIQRYGLQDRVDTRAGDFNKDSLGSGYDLVLLANVVHMYDESQARAIVDKAVHALDPGGRIILHGFRTDENDTGPLNDVMFSLNIGMLTPGGRAHPVPEKIQWLESAGVTEIRHFRIDAVPTGVITGIRRA